MTVTPTFTPSRERLNLVIGGHVDHGKSTVIGRLLADTGSLPEGKLEHIRDLCSRTARPFEYAFLLDALKDERAQGITIDSARVFFKTAARDYIILDAPGHIEFLRNMVTGAAHAEAALLVIDAQAGIQENSRRHGYMLSMLGIRQVAVLVNKMDLVDYRRTVFDDLAREFRKFLEQIDVRPDAFVPVCAMEGENIARRSDRLAWFEGPTVLETLERFKPERRPVDRPFRMPVQGVYKFTESGDDRRIIAGSIESGSVSVGGELIFYPSGKKGHVRSVETFNGPAPDRAEAGQAAGFTLSEQVFIARGELATRGDQPRPHVTTRLRVSLFWLGLAPLVTKQDYVLKLGTARVAMRVEEIHRVIDASTLAASEGGRQVDRNGVAECTLQLQRAIATDVAAVSPTTGRFVIVDAFEIRGGGIVLEALPDRQTGARDRVLLRNSNWEASFIPAERRAGRYGQKPVLLLLTGPSAVDRKRIAKEVEARLFDDGRIVYFLGMGNLLYGVDADLDRREDRAEHIRRMAEVANILLDAGIILIVSAAELTQDELNLVKTTVDADRIATVWIGENLTTDLHADLQLGEHEPVADLVERLRTMLQDIGAIFRPW